MDFDFVVKISEGEDGAYKNPEDAIKYMIETNFRNEISVYDISDEKAYAKTRQIYDEIKSYNKGKPLVDQILPTNPCKFRGTLGCLGVVIYNIGLGTYKKNHECIALFSGYNANVLDTDKEKAEVRPGLKALATFAMISEMMRK